MSRSYRVNTACLRYIVPFKLNDSFEEACKKIEKHERRGECNKRGAEETATRSRYAWRHVTTDTEKGESDLFHYIKNEYVFENKTDPLEEEKAGGEWIFWESGKEGERKNAKQLIYFANGISKKDTTFPETFPEKMFFSVSDVRVFLFRNGIGFVWYELHLPESSMLSTCAKKSDSQSDDPQKVLDSEQLKLFQNRVRELNRNDKLYLWEQKKERVSQENEIEKNRKYTTYIKPFSFANWISTELLGFLDITYIAERNSQYSNILNKSINETKNLNKENKIASDQERMVPDKAILFSYISFEKSDEESRDENGVDSTKSFLDDRQELSYHITNGYKNSYHFSEDAAREMKRPFGDVLWFATQEGASYLAWPSEDNKMFFDKNLPVKIRDYFVLYIKALYQSYSLMLYAERIQKEISAVKGKYLESSQGEKIEELFGEIQLFLAKSMATSVSHIHHQSAFYIYLIERLRIQEDVESVTAGLNALNMLQRERREKNAREESAKNEKREKESDDRIQAIMGLFALLGIFSALVDCFDFVGKFNFRTGEFWELSVLFRGIELTCLAVIVIISILAACAAVKALVNVYKNKESKKEQQMKLSDSIKKHKDK